MAWPTVRPVPYAGAAARPARVRWRGGAGTALPALLALLVVGGCEPADPARAGAERFIDRYYVEIDLPAAREHAVGFAREKLDRELELLAGIDAPESAGKPQVNYRFLQEQGGIESHHHGFLYELTITFDEGGQVVRRALVTVRDDDGVFRVANFQEID